MFKDVDERVLPKIGVLLLSLELHFLFVLILGVLSLQRIVGDGSNFAPLGRVIIWVGLLSFRVHNSNLCYLNSNFLILILFMII